MAVITAESTETKTAIVTASAGTTVLARAKATTQAGAHGESFTNKPKAVKITSLGAGDKTGLATYFRLFPGDDSVTAATTGNAEYLLAPGQTLTVPLSGVSDTDLLDGANYEINMTAINPSAGTTYVVMTWID
jgi:hypothetical protein